jgi:hypothetical protein
MAGLKQNIGGTKRYGQKKERLPYCKNYGMRNLL